MNAMRYQSYRFLSILTIAALLTLSGGVSLPSRAELVRKGHQEKTESNVQKSGNQVTPSGGGVTLAQGTTVQGSITLPDELARRLRRDLHRRTQRPPNQLQVRSAQVKTWPDGCLGLAKSDEMCTQALVEGWRVVLFDGQQEWIYRTDRTGGVIRLETQETPVGQVLPQGLSRKLLQTAAQDLRRPVSALQITSAEPRTWPDRCLGVPNPTELCAPSTVAGWRVIVSDGQRQWAYRTDGQGQILRLENPAVSRQNVPQTVVNAVLQDMARRSGGDPATFTLLQAEAKTWDGCLGIAPSNGGPCTQIAIPGWQLTLTQNGRDRWVYHTNDNGSRLQLNRSASRRATQGP